MTAEDWPFPFPGDWSQLNQISGQVAEVYTLLTQLNQKVSVQFNAINEQLERIQMSQASIDAATTGITSLLTDVQAKVADANTQIGTLATDLTAIKALIAAGQPVSTTALDAAVAGIAAVQASLDSTSAALDAGVAAVTAVASPAPPAPPAGA